MPATNYVKIRTRIQTGRSEYRTKEDFIFFDEADPASSQAALDAALAAHRARRAACVWHVPAGVAWAPIPLIGEVPWWIIDEIERRQAAASARRRASDKK